MKDLIDDIYQNNLSSLDNKLSYTDINILDDKNNSLLHYAIMYKRIEICYYLINKHIFLNQQNNNKITPLYLACHYNLVGVVTSLLKNNANVNICDARGDSPFYHACKLGRGDIIDVFLEFKLASFNELNRLNENGLFGLIYSNNLELFKKYYDKELLYSKNSNNDTMLHIAVKQNDFSLVNFLLKENLYCNLFNREGKTPIYYSVLNKNYEITKLLLKNGALTFFDDELIELITNINPNLLIYDKTKDYYMKYKLHYSIIKGDRDLFENNNNSYQFFVKDFNNYSVLDLAKIIDKKLYKKLIELKRLK